MSSIRRTLATMHLKFRKLPDTFAICRLPSNARAPSLSETAAFTSITRTADELSIVCPAADAPASAICEAPWTCFKLQGPFPFSLTGVLSSFLGPLAERGVPIFAVATFDTDYILVKEELAAKALDILLDAGHELIEESGQEV
jgi:hypothetical protein